MNREILFRGKRPDSGEWHEGLLLTNKIGTYIITEKNPHECHQNGYIEIDEYCRVSPETVGQFTGLLDKEGNKIFEGDILRTMSGIAVVVWLDAAFALKSPGSEAVDWEHSSVYEQSEILGNIHQTPELYRDGWRDCCKDQKEFD